MISIIVPVAERHKKFLKRCLLSLLDQDYDDWEAIVVFDGFEGSLPIDDWRIRSVSTDSPSGAAVARNLGRESANGELLYFFDADCTLFPGMLTLMSERLKKKNVDFVYSGYRFNVPGTMNVYPSRPFDPYLLESMNYISTMSLMKEEVFDSIDGFRPELKYFQDWDFWLRAVRKGFNGFFLKDPAFETEPSDQDSISGSSEFSFRDKILHIESLNKLPSRDICVTTLAAPVQAIERAKILNARYLGSHHGSQLVQSPAMFDMGFRAVVLMGLFPENIDGHMSMFARGAKKIVCWIGTDVWQLRNRFNWENIKLLNEKYFSQIDHHFCNSPDLQEELREVGVEAEVLYQPLTETVRHYKIPEKKIISAYFSENHPLHNKWFLQDIAQSMPDVEFKFYGGGFESVFEKNVEYVGWRPIDEIVKASRVHLRLTGHDGFPHTPIYHLLGGRRVVCNFPLKFAQYVNAVPNQENWEHLKPVVIQELRRALASEPFTKEEVSDIRKYYYDLTDSAHFIKRIREVIDAKDFSGDADVQSGELSAKFY